MVFVQLFINWCPFLLLQDRDFLPMNSNHRLLPLIDLWRECTTHLDPERILTMSNWCCHYCWKYIYIYIYTVHFLLFTISFHCGMTCCCVNIMGNCLGTKWTCTSAAIVLTLFSQNLQLWSNNRVRSRTFIWFGLWAQKMFMKSVVEIWQWIFLSQMNRPSSMIQYI